MSPINFKKGAYTFKIRSDYYRVWVLKNRISVELKSKSSLDITFHQIERLSNKKMLDRLFKNPDITDLTFKEFLKN